MPAPKDKMKLSGKQELFCQEYSKDFNQTQAYIRAGYSEKTASSGANRMLKQDKVKIRIQQLTESANRRHDFDRDWIRDQMRRLFEEARDNDDGQVLAPHKLQAQLLENMAKIEGMYQVNTLDGRSNILFNIKTGGN